MAGQRSLKTQEDVRRALAWVWREAEADRMDVQKARLLVYCALSLSQVLSEHGLEARIEALEAQANLRRTA
jgi:hypothetical protein